MVIESAVTLAIGACPISLEHSINYPIKLCCYYDMSFCSCYSNDTAQFYPEVRTPVTTPSVLTDGIIYPLVADDATKIDLEEATSS